MSNQEVMTHSSDAVHAVVRREDVSARNVRISIIRDVT